MYKAGKEAEIEQAYSEVYAGAISGGSGSKFLRMSERYRDGHWRKFVHKLELLETPLDGATFLDFGCKFGHLAPLLRSQGVGRIHSVDVAEDHVEQGRRFIGSRFGNEYSFSENCYISIPTASVDVVFVNEVISHVHPTFLDTLWSELSRVLKAGGEIFVSDGNNLSHVQTWVDLIEWYELWEKGVSKEFEGNNYLSRRKKAIADAFPGMDPQNVDHVAENTSGLFGEALRTAVRRFAEGGAFVERPYLVGTSPTHPVSGVVMERGFFPAQIELSLKSYGIAAEQICRGRPVRDEVERGLTKNFTVRGRKLPSVRDRLQLFAMEESRKLAARGASAGAAAAAQIRLGAMHELLSRLPTDAATAAERARLAEALEAEGNRAFERRALPEAGEAWRQAAEMDAARVEAAEKAEWVRNDLAQQAAAARARGDADAEMAALADLLRVSPGDAGARMRHRRLLAAAARADDAAKDFAASMPKWQTLLADDPRDAAALERFSRAARRAGAPLRGLETLREMALAPPDAELAGAAVSDARAALRAGDALKAAADVAVLLRAGVASPELDELRDLCRRKLGQILARLRAVRDEDGSEKAARAMLDVRPDHPTALNVLGRRALARKMHRTAAAHYDRLTRSEPASREGWLGLARALAALGDAAGTAAALENLERVSPNDPEIVRLRGRVSERAAA